MRLTEHQPLPFGYGIAWREWNRCTVIALPFGLHLVAGAARLFWLRLRLGLHRDSVIDHACSVAFQSGMDAGYQAGRAAGYRDGYDEGRRAGADAEWKAIISGFAKITGTDERSGT